MSNSGESESASSPRKDEVIEDAVVVDEGTAVVDESTVAPADVPAKVEPVVMDSPSPQVVYVEAPVPPKKKGNRGIGSLLAILSGLIFAAIFALVVAIIAAIQGVGQFTLAIIAQPSFYIPVLFYVIGAVLLVLIVNRAGWGAYVVGSIFVGLLVYFGTVGMLLLGQGVVLMTPTEAAVVFNAGLRNPLVIAAALVAREVSMWTGSLISRRGRRLKIRNAEARDTWERELAETRNERTAAGAATAV